MNNSIGDKIFKHLQFLLDVVSTKELSKLHDVHTYYDKFHNINESNLKELFGLGPLELSNDLGPYELLGAEKEVITEKLSEQAMTYVDNGTPTILLACKSLKELKKINSNCISINGSTGWTVTNYGDHREIDIQILSPSVLDISPIDVADRDRWFFRKNPKKHYGSKSWRVFCIGAEEEFQATLKKASAWGVSFTDGKYISKFISIKNIFSYLELEVENWTEDPHFERTPALDQMMRAKCWLQTYGPKRSFNFENLTNEKLLYEFRAHALLEDSIAEDLSDYEVGEDEEYYNVHGKKILQYFEYCKKNTSKEYQAFIKYLFLNNMDSQNEYHELINNESDNNFISRVIEFSSIAIETQETEFVGISEKIYKYFNQRIALKFYNGSNKIPYIDTKKNEVSFLSFDPKALRSETLKFLWESILAVPLLDMQCWNFNENEVPIRPFSDDVTDFKNTGDTKCFDNLFSEETTETLETGINDLFEESTTNKYWTIPPQAYCDIRLGEFEGLYLNEINDTVYFRLMFRETSFLHGFVCPKKKQYWMAPVINHARVDDAGRLKLMILLVIMTLVRDFWIVQHRETVFGSKIDRRGIQRRNSQRATKIIYLPRAKYFKNVNLKKLNTDLKFEKRRAHYVRPHARTIIGKKASSNARLLAEKYGLAINFNQTFIRAHEKGDKAVKAIYRSRSASSIVANTVRTVDRNKVDWFKFETDVVNWFVRSGFEVDHIGKSGDGGVDVMASRNIDGNLESWITQCKAYTDLVQPAVIRELIGTREIHSPGCRLLLATTGRVSEESLQLAKLNNVDVIQSIDFLDLIFPMIFLIEINCKSFSTPSPNQAHSLQMYFIHKNMVNNTVFAFKPTQNNV